VTGCSRAGKTVFLTSLINHLKYHNPAAFKLSPQTPRLVKVDDRPPKNQVWDTFPYDEYRACIACKHTWPEKTRDCSQYTLSFCRDDAFVTRHKLTLYDLPGERFADSAMTYMDFAQWSYNQLSFLGVALAQDGAAKGGDSGLGLEPVATYLKLARAEATDAVQESDLIVSYKRALAALRGQFHVYISPSTFLLDENGQHLLDTVRAIKSKHGDLAGHALVEEIVRHRYAGLPEFEFCPLGETWRVGNPDLVTRLEKRYNDYRQRVATRIFRTLTSCDGLVVLVDIANILANGPKHLNDAHFFMDQILKALKPGGQIFQSLMNKVSLRRRIRRIAVAASQCDRFHPDDWPMLEGLVKCLAERLVQDIDGIKADYFALSAVRSTTEVGDGKLRGLIHCDGGNNDGVIPEEYGVSRIPEEWADLQGWPSNWNPEKFRSLPLVLPQMPEVFQAVPEHVALARLFGFATGWFPKARD
jgi:predicted YcjX-like family ATPase